MRWIVLFILFSTYCLGQVQVAASSTIACRENKSIVSLTVSSGSAPFTFSVQTPSCSNGYTTSSPTSITNFTLPCAGLYIISVKDASNTTIGTATHSVVLSTTVNAGIFSGINGSNTDTICSVDQLLLYTQDTIGFTLSSILWSNGANGYTTIVNPSSTTIYSLSALYTTVSSKTCTAFGFKKVVVKPCLQSIKENDFTNKFLIYPNPASDELNIALNAQANIKISQILIYNSCGHLIREDEISFKNNKASINTANLPSGIYYVKIKSLQVVKKIIKE